MFFRTFLLPEIVYDICSSPNEIFNSRTERTPGEYENDATFISKVTALCVGATRFELATSRSLTGRSTKLSHAPKTFVRA